MSLSHSDSRLNNIDDINVNYPEGSQSFVTPRKQNENTNTVCDTKTQITHHKPQNRTPSSQQKLSPLIEELPLHISENIISDLKLMDYRSRQHSVQNQDLLPNSLTPF